jgi:Tol biopolymer transport system component
VVATKGGRAKPLGIAGQWPQWSPDGRWIAVLVGNAQYRRLALLPLAGGHPRVLSPHHVAAFAWSPDSSKIAFIGGQKQHRSDAIGTVDLEDSIQPFDTGSMPLAPRTPQWSPDGARIAFTGLNPSNTSQSRIYVIDADGSGLLRLA